MCHFLSRVNHVTAVDVIRKLVETEKSGKAPGVRNLLHAWYLCHLSAYQDPTLTCPTLVRKGHRSRRPLITLSHDLSLQVSAKNSFCML